MTTVSLNLPDKLVANLNRAAKARRKSRNAFVREVPAEKTRAEGAATKGSLLDRTKNLCGIGASGPGGIYRPIAAISLISLDEGGRHR